MNLETYKNCPVCYCEIRFKYMYNIYNFSPKGSRWTFQANRMDKDIGGWTLQADQSYVMWNG